MADEILSPCNVTRGFGMTATENSPKRPPYWNSTSGFDFDHITAVDCHSAPVCKIYPNRTPLAKIDVTTIFKMADLRHLKS